MILNKVYLLWDKKPENLQTLNHFFFFFVEDMALRQVSLRLLFSSPPLPFSESFYQCSMIIHSYIANVM